MELLVQSPIGTRTGGLGNKRTSRDHPNYSIIEIGQNTEKSPGDLKRLAVTQTLVKKPSANADVKNSEGVNYNNNNNNLDLVRELKKLLNTRVTIVPIGIGAFGTVTKGLLKDLEDLEVGGRVEIIQTTALLKTARILRRVLET